MNEQQAREAIRNKVPVMARTLQGTVLEYKRILCLLPNDKPDKDPIAVLEDKCGHSHTFCSLRALQESDKAERSVTA